jgi:hypothetical protein
MLAMMKSNQRAWDNSIALSFTTVVTIPNALMKTFAHIFKLKMRIQVGPKSKFVKSQSIDQRAARHS